MWDRAIPSYSKIFILAIYYACKTQKQFVAWLHPSKWDEVKYFNCEGTIVKIIAIKKLYILQTIGPYCY